MAALNLIGPAYAVLKDARRKKEAEARERIGRELAALRDEFCALTYRARQEGASVTAIAQEMGSSRTQVYGFVERGQELAGGANRSVVKDPMLEYVQHDENTGLYTVTSPHGIGNEIDPATGAPVKFPGDLEPQWWDWWDLDPAGRAAVLPYLATKKQQQGPVAA